MEGLLTVAEVAALLQVSRAQVYRLISEGLPVVEVSDRRKRFRASDIEDWVAGRTKAGAAS